MRAARGRVPALMLQGTGSNVGKSLLVAGLCRAFVRRGLRVRPFKPQNMSNNAAVTADGGEIGRAQALQARASGVPLSVHMNPVLLKPQSEVGAQVIVQGRVLGNYDARAYFALRPTLMPRLMESFQRLGEGADLILVEGAGSPAEVNLRAGDIANMGFAEAADLPVVLIGDIERGGVIASLVGTHALLEPGERERLKGYLINKFRGDPRLFDDAHGIIRSHTGMAHLGVIPWFELARRLPAEDILDLPRLSDATAGATPNAAPCQPDTQGSPPPEERPQSARGAARSAPRRLPRILQIAVPRLPRIANFDDLDPLAAEPDVALRIVSPGEAMPGDADLVILVGSKATLADLAALRAEGWDIDLQAHVRRGGWVLGICGGYQMLGHRIADPGGVEGPAGGAKGLGLLDVSTTLEGDKRLEAVAGHDVASGTSVRGYEMHLGRTTGEALARPMLDLAGRPDGAVSTGGRVMGCYVHGLFAADSFRHAFLNRMCERASSGVAYETQVEATLDALADHLEAHVDLDQLLDFARA